MHPDFAALVGLFGFPGRIDAVQRTGSGHINDTYLVRLVDGKQCHSYIFQRINHHIFRDPAALMENICRVTDHLREKMAAMGIEDRDRKVLRVLRAPSGEPWVHLNSGEWWRAFPYISGSVSYDRLETEAQAFQAARAFGRFMALLEDLPGPELSATIPFFHDGPTRLAQFQQALSLDRVGRAAQARPEIDYLVDRAKTLEVLPRLMGEGVLANRVTHNDTKINNVLFDLGSGEGLCVIDLDTVMQGSVLFDFGDLMRTTVGSMAEDATDAEALTLRPEIFRGLVRGFCDGAGSSLSQAERELLAFSGQVMALMIGSRFLTDYLDGDRYFKVSHPEQNLHRCRIQFRLNELLRESEPEWSTLVGSL